MLHDKKHEVVTLFDAVAEGYDQPSLRFFWHCARALVERACLRSGDSVLDVATGTGACAIAAAITVGPRGTVHAIDLAPEMVAGARRNALHNKLENVRVRQGDAEALDFADGTFDAVVCSSALFFVPDMVRAARECRRVLRPGGSLNVSSYGPTAFQPMSDMYGAQLREFGVDVPPRPRERLNSREKLEHLFEAAGFDDVAITQEQIGYPLAGAEEWWEVVWNSGMRRWFLALEPERREPFRRAHFEQINRLHSAKKLHLDASALFARGFRRDGKS